MLEGEVMTVCIVHREMVVLITCRYYDHKKLSARKEKKTIDASKMVCFLTKYNSIGPLLDTDSDE